jgi:cobalt-zinc-cadmium efflux system outer membrane protein
MITSLKILKIILLSVMASGVMAQQKSSTGLDNLLAELLADNPQLQAARQKTAAAKTVIRQVAAWEAPQIGVEFYQTPIQSFPNPLKDGMETDYFVQQMIPFPGKLSAMEQAARQNAGMVDQDYQALERQMIQQLKSAFYELYFVQQKMSINAESQELMKRFIEIALKQYEGGMGTQADILRAQTEFSVLLNDEIKLHQEHGIITVMINTLINHAVDESQGTIAEIKPDSLRWTLAQLQNLAMQNRPELQGMNYNIAMNKAELTFSKREYFPDLMAKVMYKNMTDTKNDFWSVMLGMNIPLTFWSGSRYTARVEENRLKVTQAENEFINMKNMVLNEIQNALIRMQASYSSMKLYKSSNIPQAEQMLQSTLTVYQTGKTEFLMVIDAYRMLLMAKLDYQMSLMNYMVSQAQLEQSVGMNINDIASQIH